MSELTLAMTLALKNQQFVENVTKSERSIKRFANSAKSDFESIKKSFNSTAGRITQLGAGFTFAKIISDSAKLDKSLIQIRQTAGATITQQVALRQQLMTMSMKTGRSVEDLRDGFNGLVQSGLTWKESAATIEAINTAMAVTNAQSTTLGSALTVAGTAFQFDLSKPGQAVELLDKMTVAGRLGNAELESLSDIFARVAVNSKAAGMSFEKTLAFVETLSMVERQPERLATLADSTLRLFTNSRYSKTAENATGVKFFDTKGSRRDAMDVLKDLKAKYDTLTTDKQRSGFMEKAFGKADQDTIKGLRTLFDGKMLSQADDFEKKIKDASGTLKKDLPATLMNAADQANRLKNTMREAADKFAMPINKVLADLIAFSVDKDKGNLNGKDIAGGLTVAVLMGWLLKRKLPGKAGNAIGGLMGTGVGVAEGLALQKATGVAPVFVVNWPAGMGGNGDGIPGGILNKTGKLGSVANKAVTFGSVVPWLIPAAVGVGGYFGAEYLSNNMSEKDKKYDGSYQKRSTQLTQFLQDKNWQSSALNSRAASDRQNTVVTPNVINEITIYTDRNISHSKSNYPVTNKVNNTEHLATPND